VIRVPVSRRRSLILWLSLLALLLAQGLGLLHRIDHLDGHASHHDSALFADHDESGRDCRLFDALSAGAGPATSLPVLVAGPSPGTEFTTAPELSVCSARPRHARARAPPWLIWSDA